MSRLTYHENRPYKTVQLKTLLSGIRSRLDDLKFPRADTKKSYTEFIDECEAMVDEIQLRLD